MFAGLMQGPRGIGPPQERGTPAARKLQVGALPIDTCFLIPSDDRESLRMFYKVRAGSRDRRRFSRPQIPPGVGARPTPANRETSRENLFHSFLPVQADNAPESSRMFEKADH